MSGIDPRSFISFSRRIHLHACAVQDVQPINTHTDAQKYDDLRGQNIYYCLYKLSFTIVPIEG